MHANTQTTDVFLPFVIFFAGVCCLNHFAEKKQNKTKATRCVGVVVLS